MYGDNSDAGQIWGDLVVIQGEAGLAITFHSLGLLSSDKMVIKSN